MLCQSFIFFELLLVQSFLSDKFRRCVKCGPHTKSTDTARFLTPQNSAAPGITEDYIAQVSEDIERRVTKTLSQEFSSTESRILGALSKLGEFLLNPQIRTFSGTTPGTFRNNEVENQEQSGDRSQNDPHPEVEFAACRAGSITDSYPEETSHMVTVVQEQIPYCSPGTSSGKQKKARSTNQPPFRSENTFATNEALQIFLALQQLASNSNSANFNNNINRISNLPKSLNTTMPIFDRQSENFELFEDLFQTLLKIHNQLTEEDRIHYFHILMQGDALKTLKIISSPSRENLAEVLTVISRKYVKPPSMATEKHKFQQLVFNPANQNLLDFLDELQKLAKDALGVAARAIIEQFIYAKMPPHLKKPFHQAHLENGTYEQIVSHLEKELELNGLEDPDEMQINTVTQQA